MDVTIIKKRKNPDCRLVIDHAYMHQRTVRYYLSPRQRPIKNVDIMEVWYCVLAQVE